jgi:hypothetical protein
VAVDDLRARPETAVEGQHPRQQVGHLLRGGGENVDGHAGVLMGVGALEHLWVEPRQHAAEDPRGEALEIADTDPRDHLPDPLADVVGPVIGRAEEPETDVLIDVHHQPPARDHPCFIRSPGEEHPRRPGHQGLVEIEEGGTRDGTAVHGHLRP